MYEILQNVEVTNSDDYPATPVEIFQQAVSSNRTRH